MSMTVPRFRRLPPLSALCAVEAVARLGSVTRAAGELGLTQSAISHNLRLVEEALGVVLFRRDTTGTVVLARGEVLGAAIHDGLSRIVDALNAVRRNDTGPELTVSILPGFAIKWLFPRLIDFDKVHSGVELSITATANLADFEAGHATVALRYGTGNYPGLHVERLFGEDMFPVCAPDYSATHALPLDAPPDLASHVLIHDDIWPLLQNVPGWRTWLDAAGYPDIHAEKGRHYSQSNLSIQAAVAGFGICLGRSPLVLDDLMEKRLVRPFGPVVPTGYAYYFVCQPHALKVPKVHKFRQWLLVEAQRTKDSISKLLENADG